MLRIVKPYKPLAESELPEETVELCEKFERQYKEVCAKSIEKNQYIYFLVNCFVLFNIFLKYSRNSFLD